MDDNLELRFGASAGNVDAVTNQIVAHLEKIAASSAAIQASSGQIASRFAGVTPHVRESSEHMQHFADHGNVAANSLIGILEQMEHVRRKIGEVAELFAAAFAIEQIAHAIERVIEWGEAHAAAAEHIEQEAQRLGMSSQAIQEWNAVATMTGHTGDEFVSAFTRLERAFQRGSVATSEQAGALRQLGIDAQAARTPQELLLQVADRFHDMPDGPQKVAIAMALMGRAGAQNIPILNEGRAALEEMMATGRQYGAVMDENMIARNAEIARTLNTSKLAMQGLGNTLFDILAPSIEAGARAFNRFALWMMESYRTGGTVAYIVAVIGTVFKEVETVVVLVGGTIWGAFELMKAGVDVFVGTWIATYDILKTTISLLKEAFVDLGRTIYYSMTYQWGAIVETVEGAASRIHNIVANSMSDAAPWFAGARNALGQADHALRVTGQTAAGIWDQSHVDAAYRPPTRPTSMNVSALGGGGGHHGGGESQVGQWEQQLHQMEIASGEYFKEQTQTELTFWQEHLAMATQGSKTWYEVQAKIFTLSRTLAQENYQEQISALDFEIQARRGHYAEMAEIEARKVELVRNTYGEESRQYRDVLREQLRMQQQHDQELIAEEMSAAQQRAAIETQASQTRLQIQTNALGMERAMIDYAVNGGTMTRVEAARRLAQLDEQEYARQLQAAEREYEILMVSLHDRMEIDGLTEQEQRRLDSEMERARADHQNRMAQLESAHNVKIQQNALAAATAYRDTWVSRLQPIESALTTMVNGFLTSTQSVRQAILQFGSTILQAVNSWIMRWVTMHIAGEHAKTAATVAGNVARTASETAANATGMAMTAQSAVAEITTHGAVAAAGALRAISHIPVIGPFIAPAIAAGILALAMGFISKVASAEGGWGQVPSDGMMTQLHKDEMVLPASIASPLRAILAAPGLGVGSTGLGGLNGPQIKAGGGTGDVSGGREGDVHLHLSALDARGVKHFLMDNRHALADALRKAARDNV